MLNPSLNAKEVYRCPHEQCLWEFSCASKLRRHLGSHTKQKNHECPQCGRRFKTWYNVQYHVRTIHRASERPYKCPLQSCGVTCTSNIQLHQHFRADHPKNALFCCSSRDCYASFLSKDEYLVHQLTHKQTAGGVTAVEVFSCDFCKAVLPTKSRLYRHRMFHIGERHFRCPIKDCGHAYFTKQHLSRHLQQGDHLKGSIMNCPKCSRVFLDRSLLDHHSTVHSSNSDYVCSYKSCDGVTICNEDDYCSHLIGTHSDTPWLPCSAVTVEEKCKISFASKELQSLHHLLHHRHPSDTLKDLSLVKYGTSKVKQTSSFVGSKEDYAIIRLIVRLYPYLRKFKIPSFDPYLASITLFNNATTTTCSDLDKILTSLSLSELEIKETINDEVQGMKEKSAVRDTCFQSPSLVTSIPAMVQLQDENQPCTEVRTSSSDTCTVTSSSTTDVDVQQSDVTTVTASSQRPLLLSMPLLTDLQPTSGLEQLPQSASDTMENDDTEVTGNSLVQSASDIEVAPMPELTSSNSQEPYNSLMFLDAAGTSSSSLCGDNISDVFDTSALSSAGNIIGGTLDLDNPALLSDDILDLANDPACVRDLMESVELSYLLPADFLESSSTDWVNLTLLDGDNAACLSNETAPDIPNFAHLSNPLADLTFESLSAIPDSILESTLQMMIENSQSSSDLLMQSPSTTVMDGSKSLTTNSSTAKGQSSYSVNKRGNSSPGNASSDSSQKRKKSLQLARI